MRVGANFPHFQDTHFPLNINHPCSALAETVSSLNSACSTRMSQSPWTRRPRKYFDQSVLASSMTRSVKHRSLLKPGTRMFPATSLACSTLALTTCEKFDIWKSLMSGGLKNYRRNRSSSLTFPKNPAPFFSLSGDVGAEMVLLVCPGATPPAEPDVLRPGAAPS